MNIYTGLLFNQGHLQDPELVRSLAGESPRDAGTDADAGKSGPPGACTPGAPVVRRHRGWAEVCAAVLSAFR